MEFFLIKLALLSCFAWCAYWVARRVFVFLRVLLTPAMNSEKGRAVLKARDAVDAQVVESLEAAGAHKLVAAARVVDRAGSRIYEHMSRPLK